MKFSHCGRLLATAGQDNIVRIWVLKTAFDYFNNMRIKYNTDGGIITNSKQLISGYKSIECGTESYVRFQVEFLLPPLKKVYVPLSRTLIQGWVEDHLVFVS